MPQISIVLPFYNAESLIQETVESILSQSFTDYELICVDDGSTDRSFELLSTIASQDKRVVIHRQKNMGPGAARNAGLERANGSYVIMLDADDIYHTHMLRLLYDKACKTDADVVACGSHRFDDATGEDLDSWWTLNISQIPNKEPFSCTDMPDFAFTAFMGWPWDKLYKRSFIEENHLRFPALSNSEDLFFVFLSIVKADRIAIVDQPLIKHRDNRNGSVSGSRSKDPFAFYRSTCLLKKKLKENPGLYNHLSWGFLNWAFEYMIWNIETMAEPNARRRLLDALKNGEFAELEIEGRSPYFYTLRPDVYSRYLCLLDEALDKKDEPCNTKRHRRVLPLIIHFLQRVDREGIGRTMKAYAIVLINRVLRKPETDPPLQPIRGSSFIPDPQTRKSMLEEDDHE